MCPGPPGSPFGDRVSAFLHPSAVKTRRLQLECRSETLTASITHLPAIPCRRSPCRNRLGNGGVPVRIPWSFGILPGFEERSAGIKGGDESVHDVDDVVCKVSCFV